MDNIQNNKRIAKNTMALYIRMLLSMVVSLYTSRVVLNTLGVVDYGIYGIVGGVVGMFSFLNSTMSGATSRFLAYELGKGDAQRLSNTFSSALIVHICIALIILVLAETAGLWLLNNKLVIPESRMFAAHWVYQLSIFSMAISVTQVPYNASIIAHEKMNVYAYVEILNVMLKLLIVFLLLIGDFDKLLLYAILTLAVSIIIAFTYRIYCVRHYEETHFHFILKRDILKPMLSYSGWDLYGNMSVMARTQGVNILLNMFFGPVLNAASTIAATVQGAVMAFAANVVTACKPQIIKLYATQERLKMVSLIRNSVRLNFLLLAILTVPLMSEIDFVLRLWLKEVPTYCSIFCVYTLLFNFFANMSVVIVTGVHATGKIRRPSMINGTLYLSVIPLTYLSFKFFDGDAWVPYLINVLAVVLGMTSNAFTLHKYVREFPISAFLFKDLPMCLLALLFAFVSIYPFHYLYDEGWIRLFLSIIVSSVVLFLFGYNFMLSSSLKHKLKNNLLTKIRR